MATCDPMSIPAHETPFDSNVGENWMSPRHCSSCIWFDGCKMFCQVLNKVGNALMLALYLWTRTACSMSEETGLEALEQEVHLL